MTSVSAEAIRRVQASLESRRADASAANRSTVRRLLKSLEASEAELAASGE